MKTHICIASALFYTYYATAFLFPDNHEIEYDYHGSVKMANPFVNTFTSGFEISGKINIKSSEHFYIISLNNVTHLLYSGDENNVDAKMIKISPKKCKELIELPVYVHRNNSVMDPKIFVHNDDEPWSIYLKKSIVMLFNLDEKHLVMEVGANFTEFENIGDRAIEVISNIVTKTDKHIVIRKDACHESESLEFETDYRRIYEDQILLCCVKELNIDTAPFPILNQLSSSTFYKSYRFENFDSVASVTQEIKLLSNIGKEIEDPADLSAYYHHLNTKEYKIRNEIEPNVQETINLLISIVNRMENMKIELNNSVNTNRDVMLLREELNKMNDTTFLDVYQKLSSLKLQNLKFIQQTYLELLSYVKSSPSVLAIVDLIKNEKISIEMSIRLLNILAYQFDVTETHVIEKLYDLLSNNSNISGDLKDAVLLCTSSMIKSVPENSSLIEGIRNKLIRMMIEKTFERRPNEDFSLNVITLLNLKLDETTSIRELFQANKPILSHHIRTLEMVTALNRRSNLNKNLIIHYQSFILNSKEEFEVRMMALYILINRGSSEFLFDTAEKLKDEKLCTDMYRIFKKIEDEKLEQYQNYEERTSKLVSRFKNCANKRLKIYDYLQNLVDFCNSLKSKCEAITFGNLVDHNFITFHISLITSMKKSVINRNSLYIYIEKPRGPRTEISPSNYKDLFFTIAEHDAAMTIIAMRNDVAIYGKTYQGKSMKNVMKDILENLKKLEFYRVDVSIDDEKSFMTDIGIPIVVYAKKPTLRMVRTELIHDRIQSNFSMDIREWNRLEYGIKTYNPIVDVWHGIRATNTLEYSAGGLFEFSAFFAFLIKFHPIAVDNDFIGFQSVGHSEAYIDKNGHSHETVMESCMKCNSINDYDVTSNESPRHDFTFWEYEDENTGLISRSKIFDCDRIENLHVSYVKDAIGLKNAKTPYGLDRLYDILNYFSIFPSFGTCGIGMIIEKNYKNSELNVILAAVIEGNLFENTSPGINKHFQILLGNVKGEEDLVKGWKFDVTLKEDRRSVSAIKLSMKNEDNFSIFVNISEEMKHNTIDRQLSLATGYYDEKSKSLDISSTFKMLMNGTLSDEQEKNFKIESDQYKNCSDDLNVTFETCISSVTALRGYESHFEYENKTDTYHEWTKKAINYLKIFYSENFRTFENKTETGKVVLKLNYPLLSDEVDISISTPDGSYALEKLPIYGKKMLLQPFSVYEYDNMYPKQYCEINTEYIQRQSTVQKEKFSLPNKWTRILSGCPQNSCDWEIRTKRVYANSDSLVLNIIIRNDTIDFHKDEKIRMYLNDQTISTDDNRRYHNVAGVDFMLLQGHQTIIIHKREPLFNIEYDGQTIKLSYILRDRYYNGLCISK